MFIDLENSFSLIILIALGTGVLGSRLTIQAAFFFFLTDVFFRVNTIWIIIEIHLYKFDNFPSTLIMGAVYLP